MSKHLINPDLQAMAFAAVAGVEKQAREKQGFVPGGGAMDPAAAAGGGGGGAPPVDPSVGGGGGGGDPNAMAGGAAPPPPPAAAPMQPQMQPVEPIKPKIDVNVTMLQILKLLARISDALGIPVPASEMVATQNDLTQMGMQQAGGGGAAGGGGGAAPQSSIPPISPIAPAAPGMGGGKQGSFNNGVGFDGSGMGNLAERASAVERIRNIRATAGK